MRRVKMSCANKGARLLDFLLISKFLFPFCFHHFCQHHIDCAPFVMKSVNFKVMTLRLRWSKHRKVFDLLWLHRFVVCCSHIHLLLQCMFILAPLLLSFLLIRPLAPSTIRCCSCNLALYRRYRVLCYLKQILWEIFELAHCNLQQIV